MRGAHAATLPPVALKQTRNSPDPACSLADLFVTPRMRVASQMRQLSSEDEGVRLARAKAEVQFRQQERPSEWKKQPIDGSTWKLGQPTSPLPNYWEAGVQYAAALGLAYAEAVARREGAVTRSQIQCYLSAFSISAPGSQPSGRTFRS
jgi:hypothetical protein